MSRPAAADPSPAPTAAAPPPAPAPAPAAGPASGEAPGRAPRVGPVRLDPTAFRAARRGAGIAAATGTRVSFTVSEPSRVTFTVHRLAAVRCRSRGARARGRGCLKDLRLRGKWVRPAAQGTNRRRFTGRLRGRALEPGRYRLYVKAQDASGRWSKARRAAFRILP